MAVLHDTAEEDLGNQEELEAELERELLGEAEKKKVHAWHGGNIAMGMCHMVRASRLTATRLRARVDTAVLGLLVIEAVLQPTPSPGRPFPPTPPCLSFMA